MNKKFQILDYIKYGNFSEYFLNIARKNPNFSEDTFLNTFKKELYPFFNKSQTITRSQLLSAWISGLLHLFFSYDANILWVAVNVLEAQKNAEENISPFQVINPELEAYAKQLVQARLVNISNQTKYKPLLEKWCFLLERNSNGNNQ